MLTAFLLSIFNILPSEERKLCYCIGRIDGEESKSCFPCFFASICNLKKNLCVAFSSHKHVSLVMSVKPLNQISLVFSVSSLCFRLVIFCLVVFVRVFLCFFFFFY